MNFEDIVDMEWVNSHTSSSPVVKEEEELYSTDLAADYYYQDDFLPPAQESKDAMDLKMEPNEPMAMPTTDQIRQLIDIAKRQLALRDQQSLQDIYTQPEPHAGTMPDTVAPESLMKQVHNKSRRESTVSSVGDEIASLEAYAEPEGIDVKKLSPKERRQLRNKISARNFRVRRKEYITTLEQQVDDHKKVADDLALRLDKVEEENKQLRQEVDSLRKQNQVLQLPQQQQQQQLQQQKATPPVSPSSSPRTLSPLPKPNLNKDISMRGTKASDTYRQDTSILVSSAVIPQWNLTDILAKPLSATELDHSVCAAYMLQRFAQVWTSVAHPKGIKESSNEKNECAARTFFSPPLMPHRHSHSDERSVEELYDILVKSCLISNAVSGSDANKDFWWW